eukprot:6962001-Ditylum_brightwellii.AAC.1
MAVVHPPMYKRNFLQSRGRREMVFLDRSDALLTSIAALNLGGRFAHGWRCDFTGLYYLCLLGVGLVLQKADSTGRMPGDLILCTLQK